MAEYNANQLSGAGTPIEALTGGDEYEFTIGDPTCSGSAYFTVETVRNSSGYYGGQPTNALGLYSDFVSINQDTLITSSYISSVVVPDGGGSYKFTPTSDVAISSSFLRGTGGITLNIVAPSFLLGDYPNANGAAYSLRLLNENITNVIRVENSSGLQRDFTPEEITDGTLTTFCGVGDGDVVTWYDQSSPSSGFDLGAAFGLAKPKIVKAGVLQTENGKPCIECNSGAHFQRAVAWTGSSKPENYTLFSVSKNEFPEEGVNVFYEMGNDGNNSVQLTGGITIELKGKSTSLLSLPGAANVSSTQALYGFVANTTNGGFISINGGSDTTGALLTTFLDRIYLGKNSLGGGNNFNMRIQEFIMWDGALRRNRDAVRTEINAYYSIY
tara:strand:- start:492 stop:1646 length:1155 start_codon:yes stop_codon:yes gene_type:complete